MTISGAWHPAQIRCTVSLPGPSGSCDEFEPARKGPDTRTDAMARKALRFRNALSTFLLCKQRSHRLPVAFLFEREIMHAVAHMKRRNFVRSLLVAPVAPTVLVSEEPAKTAAAQSAAQTVPPGRNGAVQPSEVPRLNVTPLDLAGQPAPQFFTATQLGTLRKLASVLLPPLKGNPGAVEAQAPEFLDFLIGASPDDRQKLYLSGLDRLEAQASDRFHKSFSDLDAAQADAILRPLLVARPWPQDMPSDPLQNFLAQAHEDIRTATMNSREWSIAVEKSGHRFSRGFRTSGYYWSPIDPISEG